MRRIYYGIAVAAAIALSITACNLDYFEFSKFKGGSYTPTFAIPLAKLEVTVGDLLKRFDNNIVLTEEDAPNGGKRNFLTLIFTDTLEPIVLGDFGPSPVPPGVMVPLPTERVDLKIFGNFANGEFTLTNPTVRFRLDNTTDMPFILEFRDGDGNDFYTENINNGTIRYIQIDDAVAGHPFDVPASESTSFEFNNDNLFDPNDPNLQVMTHVIQPTPKYLYYGANITTNGTSSNVNGEVQVYADVFLPLEGYGFIGRGDTSAYEFVDTTEANQLNFVELRLNILNGLPLEAKINSAIVIDTTTTPWTKLMELPLYDTDNTESDGIVVAAGAQDPSDYTVTATEKISDVVLNRTEMVQPTNIATGADIGSELSQVEALAKGNKFILDVTVNTESFDPSSNTNKSIKLYSDQSLSVRLGVRVQASLELDEVLSGEDSTSNP